MHKDKEREATREKCRSISPMKLVGLSVKSTRLSALINGFVKAFDKRGGNNALVEAIAEELVERKLAENKTKGKEKARELLDGISAEDVKEIGRAVGRMKLDGPSVKNAELSALINGFVKVFDKRGGNNALVEAIAEELVERKLAENEVKGKELAKKLLEVVSAEEAEKIGEAVVREGKK